MAQNDKMKTFRTTMANSPYKSMTGKGPVLVNDEKGDDIMRKDELMYKMSGTKENVQNEGAKQRWEQAVTMAKAGNKEAQAWLRQIGMEKAVNLDSDTATSWWNATMKDVPVRNSSKHK